VIRSHPKVKIAESNNRIRGLSPTSSENYITRLDWTKFDNYWSYISTKPIPRKARHDGITPFVISTMEISFDIEWFDIEERRMGRRVRNLRRFS
jgi:hypothetical protein